MKILPKRQGHSLNAEPLGHSNGPDFQEFRHIEPAIHVYAMGQVIGGTALKFLIADAFGDPDYVSSELFDIVDCTLPQNWGYTEWHSDESGFHYRIWGYPEILHYSHHEGLVEGRSQDKAIFRRVVREIDDSLWRDGEQAVLNELLRLNGIPAEASGFRVARREWLPGSLKTWFFSSPFTGNRVSTEPTASATVRVNEGAFDGECLLLWQDGLICGTELHYLDVELPRTVESLELKPAKS